MVEEKHGHRATETINMFLSSTSSMTKATPYAISGNIKEVVWREEDMSILLLTRLHFSAF